MTVACRNLTRSGSKARLVAFIVLFILATLVVFRATPLRWGSQGQIRYTGEKRADQPNPEYPICLVWLRKGQQLQLTYEARLGAPTEIRCVLMVRPLAMWRRPYYLASLLITQSGLGNGLFRARDTGLYSISLVGPRTWKGEIDLWWKTVSR
jgi:hypothetical protein